MLWKLVILAVLAMAGRSVNETIEDRYDEFANIYCKARHQEEKIPEFREGMRTFVNCFKGLFDLKAIKKEIEDATPNKAFGEIAKKNCAKSSQLKACIHSMLPVVTPCMPPGVMFNVEQRATDLIDFACNSEGAKITSFLKEDGMQCLDKQNLYISNCVNNFTKSVNEVVELHGGGPTGGMAITVEEFCGIEDELMTCIAGTLKGCSNQTPGNVFEELQKKVACMKQNA